MLGESQFDNTAPARPLRQEEVLLLKAMLGKKSKHINNLQNAMVRDPPDGGLRRVRFEFSKYARRFGAEIAEAEYSDKDGVFVSITINTDNHGDLYEIDIWKVDDTPLVCYPAPTQLRNISRKSEAG